MNSTRPIVSAVFWVTLAIWFAIVLAAGLAAANTFTVLGDVPLFVDGYDSVPKEDHGRLAAGMVMEPFFAIVDAVQLFAAPLCLVAFVVHWATGTGHRRPIARWIALLGLAVAVGSFGYRAAALAPDMNRNLVEYRTAAREGDIDTMDARLAAFDADHHTADALYQVTFFALFGTIIAAAVLAAPVRERKPNELETPRLAEMRP